VLLFVSPPPAVSTSTRRNNINNAISTSTINASASTACCKNHSQDAGKEGEGGRCLLQGPVEDGAISIPRHCHDPS